MLCQFAQGIVKYCQSFFPVCVAVKPISTPPCMELYRQLRTCEKCLYSVYDSHYQQFMRLFTSLKGNYMIGNYCHI